MNTKRNKDANTNNLSVFPVAENNITKTAAAEAESPGFKFAKTPEQASKNRHDAISEPAAAAGGNPTVREDVEKSVKKSEKIENNVLDFTSTLRELRRNVDPELVRHRERGRDNAGHVQTVEYVEWHTVADILDEVAPNWTHTVKDIRPIGDIMTVTVAITIDGVTREGIGTGRTASETGIKKAEHDALKRAAVKFGIARDLYKKEAETAEQIETQENKIETHDNIARTMGDLITTKQIGMIKGLARETGLDLQKECQAVMGCGFDELSKRAASQFIVHLQQTGKTAAPIRKAS